MNCASQLTMSLYKTIAVINESHNIYLVQHQDTKKIYIKKILDVYNRQIYQYLYQNKIPGIPQIIDLYEDNDQLTVIEEFVSGSSLQEKIDINDISVASITCYMYELCEILEKLHSVNPPIVHRDIKPSNIMIFGHEHVMLLDFNAAKYCTDADTSDTILLGTKGYAAPEQYGFGSSTPQTDIYAIGVLLKELVKSLPEPTDKFDGIINACTQMNPADRIQSVTVLKQLIQRIDNPVQPDIRKSFSPKLLIPPGYRTLTPWKIAVSSIIYLFVFWLSLTMDIKDTSGFALWLERICLLLIMLSVVFCSFNYCNIQHIFPLCRHQNRILHYIGIVLLDIIVAVYLLVLMFIIESIFLTSLL